MDLEVEGSVELVERALPPARGYPPAAILEHVVPLGRRVSGRTWDGGALKFSIIYPQKQLSTLSGPRGDPPPVVQKFGRRC